MTIKKSLILTLLAAALFTGCSVVFSASLSGSLYDKVKQDNNLENAGIPDMKVYLYSSEDDRDDDLDRWEDHGISPEKGSSQKYFQVTTTNAQGNYSFNGYLWEDLFPEFGKTGDRREIHLLMYHEDYGPRVNPDPIYVVSDVSTSVPGITFRSLFEYTDITGSVENTNTAEPLAGVTVRVYVSENGTYPTTPNYTLTTDAEGSYSREAAFKPPAAARITFTQNGYIADDTDPDLIQADGTNASGGTIDTNNPGDGTGTSFVDINGNGEFDQGDVYLQTAALSPGTTENVNTISLKQTNFNETLNGRVVDVAGDGQNDVVVWLYLFEDHDDDPATPEVTTCTEGTQPHRTTYTISRIEGDTPQPGYFTFANIQWTDEEYSGTSSTKMVTLYLPTADDLAAGEIDTGGPGGTQKEFAMKSAADNFVVVEQP